MTRQKGRHGAAEESGAARKEAWHGGGGRNGAAEESGIARRRRVEWHGWGSEISQQRRAAWRGEEGGTARRRRAKWRGEEENIARRKGRNGAAKKAVRTAPCKSVEACLDLPASKHTSNAEKTKASRGPGSVGRRKRGRKACGRETRCGATRAGLSCGGAITACRQMRTQVTRRLVCRCQGGAGGIVRVPVVQVKMKLS